MKLDKKFKKSEINYEKEPTQNSEEAKYKSKECDTYFMKLKMSFGERKPLPDLSIL